MSGSNNRTEAETEQFNLVAALVFPRDTGISGMFIIKKD